MAEDVCECWEDLEKSDVLDKKLQQMALRAHRHDSPADPTHELDKTVSQSASGPVKILRRPAAGPAGRRHEEESGTKLNVNSQPFVPRSQAPAIQLEDSTRTQFKPKLMILKRESAGAKGGSESGNHRQNSGPQSRTFEEREAEYLRARERIMGSASSSPSEPQAKNSSPASHRPPLLQGQPEVPLIRQPAGPSANGDRGFVRSKR
jgi:hypothetical protein